MGIGVAQQQVGPDTYVLLLSHLLITAMVSFRPHPDMSAYQFGCLLQTKNQTVQGRPHHQPVRRAVQRPEQAANPVKVQRPAPVDPLRRPLTETFARPWRIVPAMRPSLPA